MEHKTIPLRELKLADPNSDGTIIKSFSGYGAAFGNVDSYGDVIAEGAFSKFIRDAMESKQPWPSMLSQHGGFGLTSEDMTPIGAWTSLAEDKFGLLTGGDLANTQRGNEMHTLMSMKPRPAIDGLSIGYQAVKFDKGKSADEPRRTLREVKLFEISPVTFPANANATVKLVKSLDEFQTLSDIEGFLRDVGGFSITEVKTLISRIKNSIPRDVEMDNANHAELVAAFKNNMNILKGVS